MSIVESNHPVLVISFNNCDLYCCHADGYGGHIDALKSRLQAIESFFRPSWRCRVWYNVDETDLSDTAITTVSESIAQMGANITRLAVVGTKKKKKRFHQALQSSLSGVSFPIAYFDDAEKAKEWLA